MNRNSVKIVFLIPRSPKENQTKSRNLLWELCLINLMKNTDINWEAYIIGKNIGNIPTNSRFKKIDFDGSKKSKLIYSLDYIKRNKIFYTHIVRLDDDDQFNWDSLSNLKKFDFDVFCDKFHTFWIQGSNKISFQKRNWIPNTFLITKDIAMKKINIDGDNESLIIHDHSKIHNYINDNKIQYTSFNEPLYVRALNSESITSKIADNSYNYLKSFGPYFNNKRFIEKFVDSKIMLIESSKLNIKFNLIEILIYIKSLIK